MSEERRDEQPDWSRFDPHEAEREARRAERDARDAERDQARAAREQEHAARAEARDAERMARDAERMARHADRAERRENRRGRHIWITGQGLHLGGIDVEGMGFGDLAKGFMKDFAGDMAGGTYDETVTGEFTFERMPNLHVRNISGETTVKTGEPGKISVVATKHVSAGSEDRAKRLLQNLEIRMEQHGDDLHVEPHLYEQERGWVDLFRGKRVRVDLEITVPVQCGIDAHTVSGDMSVTGTRGPLEMQSVSGDVTLADAQGPLRLKSVSGDVNVSRYVGHIEGNTVSGDVAFEAVRVRSIQLHTVSGDIELAGMLEPAREHRFRTISGDVHVKLVEPDLTVEFRTASGDIESELPGRVTRQGRKEYSVALGDGRGHALVKTVSGDLRIDGSTVDVPGEPSTEEPRGAGRAPVVPEAADEAEADVEKTEPMETGPSEQVRSVLERLAKGELNVDDAAAAIDAARRGL
ncbi:MAG TPA: DUF4097 family beta strand repeat-containing protein [Candidatus Limnocylindria bacterium]|nr:DUF4097 family beta strand repeat-containing protein [Candidatus Limnocylindria bacterium]